MIARLACAIALACLSTLTCKAATYDLSQDFSPTNNPSGVWSYGAKPTLAGPFSLFAVRGLNSFEYWQLVPSQEPTIYHNGTANTITIGQGIFPPGTVFLYSGTDGASNGFGVVRFTAPAGSASNYLVRAEVAPVYEGSSQGDTDFHVVKNGVELFGRFLAPADRSGYSNILALAAGDRVEFIVGRGQDNSGTGSGLKINVRITPTSLPPPPPPPPPTNCVSAPAGLVSLWRGEGNPNDSVGDADLVTSTGFAYGAGQVGQALSFDGVDDEAFAPASSALNVGVGGGFSIETWVNPLHVTMQPLVEWSSTPNVAGVHFWLGVYGAGSIYANVVDINGGQHSWRSDTDIVVPNVLQHVGMSYEKASGLLRFYLNGQKVTEHLLGSFTPQTTHPVRVGYRICQEHFAGLLDELSIYGRVLADTDFAAIHAAGSTGKCATNAPPPLLAHDLSADFSGTSNPSGPWSYGAKPALAGPFALFGVRGLNPFEYWQLIPSQEPTIYHNGTANTITLAGEQGVFPPGTVFLYSGTDGASNGFGVVRFTVPAGGSSNYLVQAEVAPVYDGNLQGDTDFHVVRNGSELFGRFLAPADRSGYTNVLALAAGDRVDFMVGRGQDRSGTGSGLKINVRIIPTSTPPPPQNHPPVAKARLAPLFHVWSDETNKLLIAVNGDAAAVILDGSMSLDPDGDPLTFVWADVEQAQPFASGVRVTNDFELGTHAIVLMVNDGKAAAEDLVTFEVITLSEAVEELILMVEDSDLSRRDKRPILATLNAAANSFEQDRLGAGANQLRAFQEKVRAQVGRTDWELARRMARAAQDIIRAVHRHLDDAEQFQEHWSEFRR